MRTRDLSINAKAAFKGGFLNDYSKTKMTTINVRVI